MEALQIYWWFVISLLGGLLVFLLFVQGGQTMIWQARSIERKSLLVNALGRKWELTFTTLVTFGGAFFASFPLYYSTSFGGAYWLWMLILLSFILQAVSYEFRSKPANIFGTPVYDMFLWINGFFGCVLLGCAVAMQFFGADFEVSRQSILDGDSPVISVWNDSHGLEQIFSLRPLLLGFAVFFLARTLGAMFFAKSVKTDDESRFIKEMRSRILVNGCVFVLFFLAFLFAMFTAQGYTTQSDGTVVPIGCKYFYNLIVARGRPATGRADGAVRSASCKLRQQLRPEGILVDSRRSGDDRHLAALRQRLQQHRLPPLGHPSPKLADDSQRILHRVHPQGDGLGHPAAPCRHRLHRLCMA